MRPSLSFSSSFLTLGVGSRDRGRNSKGGRTSTWKTYWMTFSKKPETTLEHPCRRVSHITFPSIALQWRVPVRAHGVGQCPSLTRFASAATLFTRVFAFLFDVHSFTLVTPLSRVHVFDGVAFFSPPREFSFPSSPLSRSTIPICTLKKRTSQHVLTLDLGHSGTPPLMQGSRPERPGCVHTRTMPARDGTPPTRATRTRASSHFGHARSEFGRRTMSWYVPIISRGDTETRHA